MKIKLIASDVDGTLLNKAQQCHPRTLAALEKAREAGIMTTLATGRSFAAAWPLYINFNMNAPLITLNGALVRDQVMTYRSHYLALEALDSALQFGKELGLFTMLFHGNELYAANVNQEDCDAFFDVIRIGKEEQFMVQAFQGLDQLYSLCECQVNKVVYFHIKNNTALEDSQLFDIRKELDQRLSDGRFPPLVEPTSSFSNNIELMPKGVNKGTGLAELCEAFEIMPDEVMCFGDNENDIGMFDFAGYSVAMENASLEAKKRAKFLTGSVDEGGVGQMIEALLQGELD